MIGIKGPRGVGKTTMLLQHILENYEDIDQTLYASLDDLWFASHTLVELVDWAYRHGIMRLYLDEVHRYDQWSINLKNIYDNYPDMSIVYTSSSLLVMDNAKVDLSRRQTIYTLYGMSFREFLVFENALNIEPIPLNELIQHHVRHAMAITSAVKIAPLFEAYLRHGYYPFYRESIEDFPSRLRETVSVVIDSDLPAVENVSFETLQKVKRLPLSSANRFLSNRTCPSFGNSLTPITSWGCACYTHSTKRKFWVCSPRRPRVTSTSTSPTKSTWATLT